MKIVKNALSIGFVLGVILTVSLLISCISTYNELIVLREDVKMQQSQIEVNLQRKIELIPDFVETVKAYASHEEDIFTEIANARLKLSGSIESNDLDKMFESNSDLTSAINKLLVISEDYPELKASEHFTALQDELAGTANRISVARHYYNEKVQKYNNKILTFPSSMIADIFGFDALEYFEADESAYDLSVVDFDN